MMPKRVFVVKRVDRRTYHSEYLKHTCKWCGWETYAHPTSVAFLAQECGDCRGAVSLSVATCDSHGQYQLVVVKDGSTIGECRLCFEAELQARRRSRGCCEVCGSRLGLIERLWGRVAHSSHGVDERPRYHEGSTDVNGHTRIG